MSDLDKYIEDQTADSGVIINISKTPETEKTGSVVLKVESVEGIEGNIDLNDVDISTLSEEEKKNMIKIIEFYSYISYSNNKKLTCFDELLKYVNMTEEEFWSRAEDIDSSLYNVIESLKQNGIQTFNNYTVVNPDGDILDYQTVYANGTYTFKVVEITTGKEYTKSVQVSNIDTSMEYYYVHHDGNVYVYLLDKMDIPTTFESAYIMINNERINITNCISYSEEEDCNFIDLYEMYIYLGRDKSIYETIQTVEIVKNDKSYFGEIYIPNFDR